MTWSSRPDKFSNPRRATSLFSSIAIYNRSIPTLFNCVLIVSRSREKLDKLQEERCSSFSYRKKEKKILKIQRKSNLPSTFSFIKESTEAKIRRIPRANRAHSLFLFRLLIRRSVEIKNAFEENIFLLLLLHFLYFK